MWMELTVRELNLSKIRLVPVKRWINLDQITSVLPLIENSTTFGVIFKMSDSSHWATEIKTEIDALLDWIMQLH